ncbi:hypothetical protein HN011_004088, partial [Eciton burchellii]
MRRAPVSIFAWRPAPPTWRYYGKRARVTGSNKTINVCGAFCERRAINLLLLVYSFRPELGETTTKLHGDPGELIYRYANAAAAAAAASGGSPLHSGPSRFVQQRFGPATRNNSQTPLLTTCVAASSAWVERTKATWLANSRELPWTTFASTLCLKLSFGKDATFPSHFGFARGFLSPSTKASSSSISARARHFFLKG